MFLQIPIFLNLMWIKKLEKKEMILL